jgi:hypothetical protein
LVVLATRNGTTIGRDRRTHMVQSIADYLRSGAGAAGIHPAQRVMLDDSEKADGPPRPETWN